MGQEEKSLEGAEFKKGQAGNRRHLRSTTLLRAGDKEKPKFNTVIQRAVHTGINDPNVSHTAMGSNLTTATQKQDL